MSQPIKFNSFQEMGAYQKGILKERERSKILERALEFYSNMSLLDVKFDLIGYQNIKHPFASIQGRTAQNALTKYRSFQ